MKHFVSPEQEGSPGDLTGPASISYRAALAAAGVVAANEPLASVDTPECRLLGSLSWREVTARC